MQAPFRTCRPCFRRVRLGSRRLCACDVRDGIVTDHPTLARPVAGLQSDLERSRVGPLVTGGGGGEHDIDEMRQPESTDHRGKLGDVVRENRVSPAKHAQSCKYGKRVVVETSADRRVRVVRSNQTHQVTCATVVDPDTFVGASDEAFDAAPPDVRVGQLRMRRTRRMPREPVPNERTKLICRDRTFRMVLVEEFSQEKRRTSLASTRCERSVEVPQDQSLQRCERTDWNPATPPLNQAAFLHALPDGGSASRSACSGTRPYPDHTGSVARQWASRPPGEPLGGSGDTQ
jgi:hypothetical protein